MKQHIFLPFFNYVSYYAIISFITIFLDELSSVVTLLECRDFSHYDSAQFDD